MNVSNREFNYIPDVKCKILFIHSVRSKKLWKNQRIISESIFSYFDIYFFHWNNFVHSNNLSIWPEAPPTSAIQSRRKKLKKYIKETSIDLCETCKHENEIVVSLDNVNFYLHFIFIRNSRNEIKKKDLQKSTIEEWSRPMRVQLETIDYWI